MLDVCKIERDIIDLWSLNYECIRMVRRIYSFQPNSACPLVPIMPSPVASLFHTEILEEHHLSLNVINRNHLFVLRVSAGRRKVRSSAGTRICWTIL